MDDKKKRRTRKSPKTSVTKGPADAPPSRSAIEHTTQSIFGPAGGAAFQAQDLTYEAMEIVSPKRQLPLLQRALKLNPRCVDALLMLAQLESRSPDELMNRVSEAVKIGEEDLGPAFFKEHRGYFWGILETRPYMRARGLLADLLAKQGRIAEAVTHLEAMLKLNPSDNQGLRYVLLGHYFVLDHLDRAAKLFKQYRGECSAMFAWARVLERFLAGDQASTELALAKARNINSFAEPYLSGKKRLPRQLPDYYSPGDDTEGIVCAVELGAAWAKHPAAIAWLKSSH